MKILFFLRHPLYLRNYETVVEGLCAAGHEVVLLFSPLGREFELSHVEALAARHPGVSVEELVPREGWWWPVGDLSRWALDYLRYERPEYLDARALVRRTHRRAAPEVREALERSRLLRGRSARVAVAALCRLMERSLPPDPACLAALQRLWPDLVIVTPMVDFATTQTDFLKAARGLGIPTLLAVASWDNLTNKGLVHFPPDRTLVWNDFQKKEAVQLHGLAADSVVATGAQLFDEWFEREPSCDRAAFCSRVGGFDPDRPILLYLCSSYFICPDEVGFVQRWLAAVRASDDPVLATANVLVRPHPANAAQWANVDPSRLLSGGPLAIWPASSGPPLDEERKRDYFDSLYFAGAAIGINTSALIEAGIVGCRSFTLSTGDFGATQEGTLHFRYLVNGGLLKVAHSFDEHLEQLGEALRRPEAERARLLNFVRRFVRPHGLERPATPIFLEEVERTLTLSPEPWRPPAYAPLVRAATYPAAAALRRSVLRRAGSAAVRGAEWLEFRRFALPSQRPSEAVTKKLQAARGRVLRHLAGIARSQRSIVVGPWMSEVGFELLYWIPMLRWAQQAYAIEPERMVVVSRGGVRHWYGDLAGRYLDLFDLFTPEEFVALNEQRKGDSRLQKQVRYAEVEKEILKEVSARFALGATDLLHPHTMYKGVFRFHWSQRSSIDYLRHHARYEPLPPPEPGWVEERLPEDFYAVRFYARDSFNDSGENRAFVRSTIERMLERSNVVLLDSPFAVDEHREVTWMTEQVEGNRFGNRLIQAGDWMRPANNLDIQTRIIARSRGFVGTYGGLSYLAPLLGKPAIGFHEDGDELKEAHVNTARTVFRSMGVPFILLTPGKAGLLRSLG